MLLRRLLRRTQQQQCQRLRLPFSSSHSKPPSNSTFAEFQRVVHRKPLPSPSPLQPKKQGLFDGPVPVPHEIKEQQANDIVQLLSLVIVGSLVGAGLWGYQYFLKHKSTIEDSKRPVLSKAELKYKKQLENKKNEKEILWHQEQVVLLKQKALYDCEVLIDNRIGGGKNIKAKYGDILEVLQENTGPGNQYAMCRTKGEIPHVGFFPTHYLGDKVETKNNSRGWLHWP